MYFDAWRSSDTFLAKEMKTRVFGVKRKVSFQRAKNIFAKTQHQGRLPWISCCFHFRTELFVPFALWGSFNA